MGSKFVYFMVFVVPYARIQICMCVDMGNYYLLIIWERTLHPNLKNFERMLQSYYKTEAFSLLHA